jgi:hypothetical protein
MQTVVRTQARATAACVPVPSARAERWPRQSQASTLRTYDTVISGRMCEPSLTGLRSSSARTN